MLITRVLIYMLCNFSVRHHEYEVIKVMNDEFSIV